MDFSHIVQLLSFAFAAAMHGLTGMGFPMIGTAALSLMLPMSEAVALVALPSLLMSLLVLLMGKSPPYRSSFSELSHYGCQYWLLIVTSVAGSIIGVKLLLVLPAVWLYLSMAAVTLYYSVFGWLSLNGTVKNPTVPATLYGMAFFGMAAGIVGGATNVMSPLLLMFLFSYTADNHEIAKVSNICYLLSKLVQLSYLWGHFSGFGGKETFLLLGLTAVSIVFLIAGIRLRKHISQILFRKIIYIILFALALKVGYSGMAMLA